ncbi:MAG: hypothetical protein WC180_05420 [Candidatus Paceibacterota bacterium]
MIVNAINGFVWLLGTIVFAVAILLSAITIDTKLQEVTRNNRLEFNAPDPIFQHNLIIAIGIYYIIGLIGHFFNPIL